MALPSDPGKRLPSQESLLLDYVHRLDQHRAGRSAVRVYLSELKPYNRREHHVRIAANAFDSMVKVLQGQLFVLKNSDLVFIFKNEVRHQAETAIVKLRFLFSDDPLLGDSGDGDDSRFCTWYDVETDYDLVLRMAQDLARVEMEEEVRQRAAEAGAAGQVARREGGDPLTPEVLARIEDALTRADLSNMMRRQYVCAVVGTAGPQPVFSELFISVRDLRETLLPTVNLASNRWLFQHLTETLDRRVLSLLGKTDFAQMRGDLSFNLNVSTLTSPEFLAFDEAVPASRRGSMVVELQKVDIFADLGAYLFAREFVRERGYRVCIDGLTHLTLPFIDRERLGADLLKLVWHPDMVMAQEDGLVDLKALVAKAGGERVVMCRCDTREAVDFGQSIGIALYQGRHIENLIAEEGRKRTILMNMRRRR
jgi:hypothetical protein